MMIYSVVIRKYVTVHGKIRPKSLGKIRRRGKVFSIRKVTLLLTCASVERECRKYMLKHDKTVLHSSPCRLGEKVAGRIQPATFMHNIYWRLHAERVI
jgi:hypothetical protein